MIDKNNITKYLNKLKLKYRFVIMTESAFEEKSSITFSLLKLIIYIFCVIAVIVITTILIFGYTPLKKYIPGKSSEEVQKNLIALSLQADSLKKSIDSRNLFLNNLNNIINGKQTVHLDSVSETTKTEEIVFKKSKEDSLFRNAVESEDKKSIYLTEKGVGEVLMFFSPLNGVISSSFDEKIKHFGIDIVGDFVHAGENIAIIGNSGELTSGPHLHFELWHNGGAVDPINFINFRK